jgi:hypothetical protein
MAADTQGLQHQPMEVRHRDEVEWETIRWPGETGKMLFHPRPERPTEPNAGILRLEPGAHHPLHKHDFAQVCTSSKADSRSGAGTAARGR